MIFLKIAAELWPLIDVYCDFMHTWPVYSQHEKGLGGFSDNCRFF